MFLYIIAIFNYIILNTGGKGCKLANNLYSIENGQLKIENEGGFSFSALRKIFKLITAKHLLQS
jgi:high-affinity nickel permease